MSKISYPPESHFQQFSKKQIMSIDYGEKITGIATFIPDVDPFPLMGERIIFKNQKILINELTQQVAAMDVEIIVLGKPLLTDGKSTPMTEKILSFGVKLKEHLQLPVYLQDETLSTQEAKERMKNSPAFNFKVDMKKIDNVAAVIILEDFLMNTESDKI